MGLPNSKPVVLPEAPIPKLPPTPQDEYINDYKLIRKLGEGAFGEVFLVLSRRDNKKYALKKISVPDGEKLNQILLEAAILSNLKHPNIVSYVELNTWVENNNKYVCIIMEYIDGLTLTKFIEMYSNDKSIFSVDRIITWFIKLIDALKYIHDKNIIHRDLKPDNIFLFLNDQNQFELKIGDFGVSCSLDETVHAQTFAGTPAYMAPEQLTRSKYTNAVDIWAIGCILVQAFFGWKEPKIAWALQLEQLSLLNYIDDPSIRLLANSLLTVNDKERPSAQTILGSSLILGWKKLLYNDEIKSASIRAAISYLSGLNSSSNVLKKKSLQLLSELPMAGLQLILKEYKGLKVLLRFVMETKEQEFLTKSIKILSNFVEMSHRNKDFFRESDGFVITGSLISNNSIFGDVFYLMLVLCSSNPTNQIFANYLGWMDAFQLTVSEDYGGKLALVFPSIRNESVVKKALETNKSAENLSKYVYSQDMQFLERLNIMKYLSNSFSTANIVIDACRFLLENVTLGVQACALHGVCSAVVTGNSFSIQPFFHCNTCWPATLRVCCVSCAKFCHKGHELVPLSDSLNYCDCFSRNCKIKSKIITQDNGDTPSIHKCQLPQIVKITDNFTVGTSNEILSITSDSSKQISLQFKEEISISSRFSQKNIFYVEITVNKPPKQNYLGIGLATSLTDKQKTLGFSKGSYGYFGDDGKKFCEGNSEFYGPNFTIGDTIGMGVNSSGNVYYTKNGFFLGFCYCVELNIPYHFSIEMMGGGITINTGSAPYAFASEQVKQTPYDSSDSVKLKMINLPNPKLPKRTFFQEQFRDAQGFESLLPLITSTNELLIKSVLSALVAAAEDNEQNRNFFEKLMFKMYSNQNPLMNLEESPDHTISYLSKKLSNMRTESTTNEIPHKELPSIASIPEHKEIPSPTPTISSRNRALTNTLPNDSIENLLVEQLSNHSIKTTTTNQNKLRVFVRFQQERAMIVGCTNENETFQELLQRLKLKSPKYTNCTAILVNGGEVDLNDRVFDILEDKESVELVN